MNQKQKIGFFRWNRFCALLFFCIAQTKLYSQGNEKYFLNIKKATGPIVVDGEITEADWQLSDSAGNFFLNFPFDTSEAKNQTVVYMTYDNQNLYIAAKCFDPTPEKCVIQSLKRDFSYPVTDAFAVYIDPFMDKTNGFNFTVSPVGVQREGSIDGGGMFGVTTAWDNKWFSEVHCFLDRWEVEMAIPFKTLRYKKGLDTWRINFSRNDLKSNENSSWVPVPRGYNIATLAYTGLIKWDAAAPKTGTNISLIPYALAAADLDHTLDVHKLRWNAGGDAKIVVTPALNLDLTVNPDFSQVEVDRQVTNLSRFELFFPERRQFFIENSDLFGNFGFRAIRPFFSRRIGLSSGTAIPIYAGARLSGKLSKNLRIGFLNMQTAPSDKIAQPGENYTVAVFNQKVFNRSNIAGIFVNRQKFDGAKPDGSDYNRLIGVDYNLQSKNNKWVGKFFYHYSFDNLTSRKKMANAAWLQYQTPKWTLMYNHEHVQKNFNAEVGYVPRKQFFRIEPMISYRFYPRKGKVINNHGPELYTSQYWNDSTWKLLDSQIDFGWQMSFQNRSAISLTAEHWYTYLYFPFDPTRTGGKPLPLAGYTYYNALMEYASDFRKKLNYSFIGSYGKYFNGTRLLANVTLNFRIQPWAIFSVSVEHNNIRLPQDYADASLFLISPRAEFSFTRKLFFTTFFQYNTQIHNFNINARFQWRFRPMSDLYVVITQNYGTDNQFSIKNQAIVLKLNYWLNL